MPRTEWGWLITPDELRTWILHEGGGLLVVNKPAHVVCHPSKHGPWSSLIGACREYLGKTSLHMLTRLDRETSGLMVITTDGATARRMHKATTHKEYQAILCGELREAVTVEQPIGLASDSAVASRRRVAPDGQPARTEFLPVRSNRQFTLARAIPHTGRTHQIRVHAAWLGHPVAGDKIYGPDERLFLEFLERGFTERHRQLLVLERQALHAARWESGGLQFEAPPPADWLQMLSATHLT